MSNPYTPGYDRIPPVLAGREREISILDQLAEDLTARRVGEPDVVLYGPRGNGKTALLNYAQKSLQETSRIRSIKVLPIAVETSEQLHSKLLNATQPSEKTVTVRGGGGLGVAGTRVEGSRETAKVFPTAFDERERLCISVMAERPTLLMVDEAHHMTKECLWAILSLSQAANQGATSFKFILSGTPNLPTHLQEIGFTYLNRSQRVRMERLDVESAKTALFQPMVKASYNIRLSEAEKGALIAQTQCYPHFIQSVGHALWDAAETTGRREIDAEIVAHAKPAWERRMNSMYGDRLRELRVQKLAYFARAIAIAFSDDRADMSDNDIERVLLECDPSTEPEKVKAGLEALGYLWEKDEDEMHFEPGIPSLMDYVIGRVPNREDPSRDWSRDEGGDLER